MNDHGGNIFAQSLKLGLPAARIVDFSASINPLGMPPSARREIEQSLQYVPHYPEPYAESLSTAVADRYGVSAGSVLCGNGSTELIYLIAKVLKPKRVLVTAPAFSEYKRACKPERARIIYVPLKADRDFAVDADGFIRTMKAGRCELAFLCNPNNPTGRLLPKRDVQKIAAAARSLKMYFVVDEAFIDFCGAESVISSVARNPYLVVLRSMTKFYALAGLRIGFGVFPKDLAARLKTRKEPWSVNILAAAAGRASLSDSAYQRASLSLMRREKRYLEKRFRDLNIRYFPSDANYYLLFVRNPAETVTNLSRKGILIRDCSNFEGLCKGYVRIAVRSREENALLVGELGKEQLHAGKSR